MNMKYTNQLNKLKYLDIYIKKTRNEKLKRIFGQINL